MHYKLVKNKLTKEIITLHALFTNKGVLTFPL